MEKIREKDRSREILAFVIIGFGLLWMAKEVGIFHHFPFLHLEHIFRPVRHALETLSSIFFSWQMILIVVGLVLVAGNRSAGWTLIIIGGVFLIPKIFIFSGISLFLFFPIVLIAVGISLIIRKR